MAAAVNVTASQLTSIKMSRHELLAWVNETLDADFNDVEQMCTGAAYCQFMDILFPGSVPIQKVIFHTNVEYEFFHNFKLLQAAFEKHRVTKEIPINVLIKGRKGDNFEFLQWFKRFFDANYELREYDARAARNGVKLAFGTPNTPQSRSFAMPRATGRSKLTKRPTIRYPSENIATFPTPLRWAAASRVSGAYGNRFLAISRDTQTSSRASGTESRDTQASQRDNITWALQPASFRRSRNENRELGGTESARQSDKSEEQARLDFRKTHAKLFEDQCNGNVSAEEIEKSYGNRLLGSSAHEIRKLGDMESARRSEDSEEHVRPVFGKSDSKINEDKYDDHANARETEKYDGIFRSGLSALANRKSGDIESACQTVQETHSNVVDDQFDDDAIAGGTEKSYDNRRLGHSGSSVHENCDLSDMESNRESDDSEEDVRLNLEKSHSKVIKDPYDIDADATAEESEKSHGNLRSVSSAHDNRELGGMESARPSDASKENLRLTIGTHGSKVVEDQYDADASAGETDNSDRRRRSRSSNARSSSKPRSRGTLNPYPTLQPASIPSYLQSDPLIEIRKTMAITHTRDSTSASEKEMTKQECFEYCRRRSSEGARQSDASNDDKGFCANLCNSSHVQKAVTSDNTHEAMTKRSCVDFCTPHFEHIDETETERVNMDEPAETRDKTEYESALANAVKREKDFYYDKLRDIEVVVTDTESDSPTESLILEKVTEVLYKIEDGFAVPISDDSENEQSSS